MDIKIAIVSLNFRKPLAYDDFATSFENSLWDSFSLGGTDYSFQSFGRNFINYYTGLSSLCVYFIEKTYSIRMKKEESLQEKNYFNIIDNIIDRVFNKAADIVTNVLQLYFPDEFYLVNTDNTKSAKITQEDTISYNECPETFFYKFLEKKTYSKTLLMLVFYLILLSHLLFKQRSFIQVWVINIFVLLMLYLLTYRHAVFRTKNLETKTYFITRQNTRSCYYGEILGFSVENSCYSCRLSMGCS